MISATPAKLATVQLTFISGVRISEQQYFAPIRRQIQAGPFSHNYTGQTIVRTEAIDANPTGQNSILIAMRPNQNTALSRKSP